MHKKNSIAYWAIRLWYSVPFRLLGVPLALLPIIPGLMALGVTNEWAVRWYSLAYLFTLTMMMAFNDFEQLIKIGRYPNGTKIPESELPRGTTVKQVLVLRTDAKMATGKMVAQGAHASMAAILNKSFTIFGFRIFWQDKWTREWLSGRFTKISLRAQSEDELKSIYESAKAAGIPCSYIVDSGLTVFKGVPTPTAVAVGPACSTAIDQITGSLKVL